MTTGTLTLTAFLLARIAEDEENVEGDWLGGDGGLHIISTPMHQRLRAECEAKRRIVALFPHAADGDGWNNAGEEVLCLLALPYADHPDYREEWKP